MLCKGPLVNILYADNKYCYVKVTGEHRIYEDNK